MAKAKWSTTPHDIVARSNPDGSFEFSAPLVDDGTKAATVRFNITAARVLRVEFINEPGAAGLAGFEAWSKEP